MNLTALFHLMRPKQWIKNLFVLAPLIFGFKMFEADFVIRELGAFVVFCLVASAVYIINDWRDIHSDRAHPIKRRRPLASGVVKKSQAICVSFVLGIAAAAIIFFFGYSFSFLISLCLYIGLSVAYSLGLKHIGLLELFIVASGYILRLLVGCAAIGQSPSPWILAATGSVALLMVAGKRHAEISENRDPDMNRKSLRHYNLAFLDSVVTLLAAITVVTYLLFTTSDYAVNRFHAPYFVATSVFVLFGVLRYVQMVKLGTGADDPTLLVLTDKSLRYTVLCWLATCIFMIYF